MNMNKLDVMKIYNRFVKEFIYKTNLIKFVVFNKQWYEKNQTPFGCGCSYTFDKQKEDLAGKLNSDFYKILINKICNISVFELFINFLKDEYSYEEFINNLKNNGKAKYRRTSFKYKSLNELFKDKTLLPYSYIACAFKWDATKEGDSYWLKLHTKWSNKIDDIIKNSLKEK